MLGVVVCLFSLMIVRCANVVIRMAGGPYDVFAGRDATRGLATFRLKPSADDDARCFCNLSQRHLDNARRWDKTFQRQFLIKPL